MTHQVPVAKSTTAFVRTDWSITGGNGLAVNSSEQGGWEVSVITVGDHGALSVEVTAPNTALPGNYTVLVRGEAALFWRHWLYEGTLRIE